VVSQRETRQKRALAVALRESGAFRSAQDLFAELRARGQNVGLTTVYNQLRALSESGEVDTVRTADGETLYRRCATGHHHHHLGCGTAVEIEGPEVERWADGVATRHGFVDIAHTVEIVGTCAACAGPPRPGPDLLPLTP
jgi:Fur family ferric uptake transcriptional regulator